MRRLSSSVCSPSSHRLNPVTSMATGSNSLIWFRKGLRVHDNPALEHASKASSGSMYPVFVIDPRYMEPDPSAFSPGSSRAGVNRIRFLLESLKDLDSGLKKLGSRLLVLRGEPGEVLVRCLREWKVKRLCFEYDTDPYYQALDFKVKEYASSVGVEVFSPVSHTLFNPTDIIQKNGGKAPLSYQSFLKIAGEPSCAESELVMSYSSLPPIGDVGSIGVSEVPTLEELGYRDDERDEWTPFRGGESEALKRLNNSISDKAWVANFEKPKGDPSAFLKPATTVLSPYLKDVKKHTSPPVSLLGQLLWREFFYTTAFGTRNFDKMKGNPICKQIPWKEDHDMLAAWRDGKTGYPWIDAIMVQLLKWGWMHHLARHSVACFLTRGDLFIHWEQGRDVFERLLIDSDWAINNGNWMWLSLVMHDAASKECKRKMGEANALNKKMNGNIGDDDLKDLRRKLETDEESNIRNQRPKLN
ncbi:hypothetical protein F2Q68_00032653 [Brassica cretica]|uniref:Photolyase/cryptochrome alpha/beta domain-containing protein n=1 Tax=Brassica cretica TaxID=69181 RepID=A0A8S9G4L2_BRACR|nr:hypothetical protein F2Q68_00032653 [Brassica cretica]